MRDRRDRTRRRVLRGLGIAAGVGFVLASAAAIDARIQRGEARTQAGIAAAETKVAKERTRIAEYRRLAALSDAVRPERLDLAMLLALEAAREETHPRRVGACKALWNARRKSFASSTSPKAMSRAWLSGLRARSPRDMVSGGRRRRGAFRRGGSSGSGACWRSRRGGYERGVRAGGQDRRRIWPGVSRGGVVLFDGPGRAAPRRAPGGPGGLCHERGLRARGPDRRRICRRDAAAWCSSTCGERCSDTAWRSTEGHVTSVAFGPEGKIAAGYGRQWSGGVVLFDARGERLRAAPLEVKEGPVTSVAFGPTGKIAAGYSAWTSRRRRGALRRPGRAAPTRAAGGQGGLSRAWPSGRRARSPRDMAALRYRRRRGALRRAGRAAPTRAAGGQGGQCHERGLRAGGQDRRGISGMTAVAAAAWCSSTPGRAASTRAAGGQGGLCQERGLRAGGQDRRGI